MIHFRNVTLSAAYIESEYVLMKMLAATKNVKNPLHEICETGSEFKSQAVISYIKANIFFTGLCFYWKLL